MPISYIVLHLVLSALCFQVVWRLPARPVRDGLIGLGFLLAVIVGFALERSANWSWLAMRFAPRDLVFFINISLEGVAVLLALLWKSSNGKWARARAAVYSAPLLGLALWSYAWYFLPIPPDLHGAVDKRGLCLQTSDDSCSAAAATMLLAHFGIKATEKEMAQLCLTRIKQGTPPLGLFRGLSVKGSPLALRPQLVTLSSPAGFHRLGAWCIIGVGVRADAPNEIKLRMENYGWQQGQRHTIVIQDADPKGKWIQVADPSNGSERWPTKDLEYLWDGKALILAR